MLKTHIKRSVFTVRKNLHSVSWVSIVFAMGQLWKTVTTSEGSYGLWKTLRFKFKHFPLLQKWDEFTRERNSGNIFLKI